MLELSVDDATCTISPHDGGRLGQLIVGGRRLLRDAGAEAEPMGWGCFPMAPFAGRVREGRFQFDGREYQLAIGLPPHAIHGTVYTRPWSVNDVGDTFVAMSTGLDDHWPFGGSASQRMELFDGRVELSLTVTADELAMPAQVGWHPWFAKPDAAQFEFRKMYARDEAGIPSGALVDPPPPPWDDCFVEPTVPIELTYADLVVRVDSDCNRWVIYDHQADATCVEPQSGPPDGFNSSEPGAFARLAPGETLQRTMTISWTRPDGRMPR